MSRRGLLANLRRALACQSQRPPSPYVHNSRTLCAVAAAGGVAILTSKDVGATPALQGDQTTDYVVVGSGVAAVAAIDEMLRRGVTPSSITMVGEEVGGISVETDLLREGWSERLQKGVNVREGTGVVRLDSVNHELQLCDGSTLRYQKCVLAPQDVAALPPVDKYLDKTALRRAFAARHRRDLTRLDSALDKGVKRVTVVGGGWVGCEMACALADKGLQVTMIFTESAPLAR